MHEDDALKDRGVSATFIFAMRSGGGYSAANKACRSSSNRMLPTSTRSAAEHRGGTGPNVEYRRRYGASLIRTHPVAPRVVVHVPLRFSTPVTAARSAWAATIHAFQGRTVDHR